MDVWKAAAHIGPTVNYFIYPQLFWSSKGLIILPFVFLFTSQQKTLYVIACPPHHHHHRIRDK